MQRSFQLKLSSSSLVLERKFYPTFAIPQLSPFWKGHSLCFEECQSPSLKDKLMIYLVGFNKEVLEELKMWLTSTTTKTHFERQSLLYLWPRWAIMQYPNKKVNLTFQKCISILNMIEDFNAYHSSLKRNYIFILIHRDLGARFIIIPDTPHCWSRIDLFSSTYVLLICITDHIKL